jgi:large repetitive protein
MANSVAIVASLEGQAWAKSADGTQRPLKVGDTVTAEEVVITATGARIELDFGNGKPITIAGGQEVLMDRDLWTELATDKQDAAVDNASVQEALTVLNQGGDLTTVLEETAAGLNGGGANEGHSFVALTRILESTNPSSFNFGANNPDVGTTPNSLASAEQVNHAPEMDAQSFAGDEDTLIVGQIIATDVENDVLSYSLVGLPANGTITLNPATGSFVYTPNGNYNGPDSFVVTVTDDHGNSTTTTVGLTVIPVNDVPVSSDQNLTTPEDTPINGAVVASDVDGDTLNYVVSSTATHGTVTLNPATGAFVYTPGANYNGSDKFIVTISDGQGGTTTSTINIGVTPVNDPPVSADQNLTTPEDTPLPGQVVASDVDGDTLSYVVSSTATHGSVTLNPATGAFVYTPGANYNGSDKFIVTISDGQGGTTTSTINIGVTPVNDPPVSADQNLTTPEDTPINGAVVASDVDGDTLSYVVSSTATHGSVTLNPATGAFVYTPGANYNGSDKFIVTISDGQGGTTTSTINIGVTPVNDPPVSADQNLTTPEDTPLPGQVVASDVDGDTLSYVVSSTATHGTVTLNPATGAFVYTPGANYNGSDKFIVTISDGQGGTTTSTINIGVTPVNDPPVSADQNLTTPEDTPINGAVVASDVDGDTLSYVVSSTATHGTVTLNPATGAFVYTPGANYNGSDKFIVTISDGQGGTTTSTINIGVTPVNDPPIANSDSASTLEATAVTVAVRANDTDPDGDSLTVTAVTQGANGSVVIDAITGNPIYTPIAGFTGTDTFTYTISDGNGGTATASVNVAVNALSPAGSLSLTATPSLTEAGGNIVYTATLTNAQSSNLTVTLQNGEVISITAGQLTGSVTVPVAANEDVYVDPSSVVNAISSATGGNAGLVVNTGNVTTSITDTIDTTTVSLSASASVAEGGSIVYTATLTSAAQGAVTVNLSNGSVITIANGATTGTVSVAAPSDDVYLDASTVSATISSASGGNFENLVVNPAAANTSITDTLDTTTLSLTGAASITEGSSGVYTLSLTSAAQTDVTVTLTYSGVAGNGTDISGATTVTILAGTSSANFNIAALTDALVEGTESFTVALASATGGNFETLAISGVANSITTTVLDANSATVSLSATPSITEAGGNVVYTATISTAPVSDLTVTLSNGNSITILAGQTTGTTTVAVAASDDVYIDPSNMSATITGTSGGGISVSINPAAAVTSITDTIDTTTVSLTASGSVAEGGSIVYTATLTSAAQGAVTVNLSNGSVITIANGATTGTVSVAAPSDDVYLDASTVSATISSASGGNFENLVVNPAAANTSITDTLDTTTLSLTGAASITEGSSGVYTLSLTSAAQTDVTVTLTYSGVAGNGTDISGATTVTILAGTSSANFNIAALTDALVEGTESFTVALASATGGNFETLAISGVANSITTTVLDANSATVSLSATPSITEAGGNVVYTATISTAPVSDLTVTLSNGNSITILAGQTTGTTTVAVAASDDVYIDPSNMSATITGTSGGGISVSINPAAAVTSITDTIDTTTVSLTASGSVAEGGSIVYTATLTNAAQGAVTVNLSNGSVITIANGATTGTVSVAAPSDDVYLDASTVSATISSASGGNFENLVVNPAAANTSITDTLDTTTLSLTGAASITEGSSGVYTLSLTSAAQTDVTVTLTYSGVAGNGTDISGATTVTILAGTSSANFNIAALTDNLVEGNETFTVAIGSAAGGNFESLVVSGAAKSVTTTVIDVPPNNAPVAVNDPVGTAYSVKLGDYSASDLWTTVDSKGLTVAVNGYKSDGSAATIYQNTIDGNTNTIGVNGTPRTVTPAVVDQIEYDQTTGKSEALELVLNGNVNQATFSVSRLFPGENGGEQGMWSAYYQGTLVAQSTFRLLGASNFGAFTINTGSLVFDSVKFTALNTVDGSGDGGDYFLTGFSASGNASQNTGYTLAEGASLNIGSASSLKLLSNDSDVDGDSLVLTKINGANVSNGSLISLTYGDLVIQTDGSFSYVANKAAALSSGQLVTDSFTYTISDGHGGTATATATMTIIGKDLTGTAGNDILIGGAYSEQIVGGRGNDTMTGGLGADTFKWSLNDQGSKGSPAIDTITDFSTAQGDKLDLRDLLQNENSGNLTNYLHFASDGTNTTVSVSSTGSFNGSNYTAMTDQTIVLNGVNLTGTDTTIINLLKTNGNLITD